MPDQVILRNTQAPGDLLMLTAALRDLHRCYPGQYETGISVSCKDIFRNNPYVKKIGGKKVRTEVMHYPMIHQSNQGRLHFIQGFIQYMNSKWSRGITLTEAKPDVHLTADEMNTSVIEKPYWVIASGGKGDYTAKWWDPARWQKVVNQLKGEIRFVQVGAGKDNHPPLTGAIDLRGKTTLRELMQLIYNSEGVCCVVTCLMHMAAAFEKPCVVVAGGREPWWWEWYTNEGVGFGGCQVKVPHVYLQSMGKMDCCKRSGCWRSKILPTKPGKKQSLCARPTKLKNGTTIPECLAIITPEQVVEGVRMYGGENMSEAIVDFGRANAKMPEPPKPGEKKRKNVPQPIPQVDEKVYDTGEFGSKVTIFTLLYGEHFELHERNLRSIVKNTPKGRFELRIGLNEVCDRTMKWIQKKIVPHHPATLYIHPENAKKYPVMREMFHDPDHPIETKWMCWFDDDSYVKDPMWLYHLAQAVNMHYPNGCKMFGKRYYIHLEPGQKAWIESAKWYRNVPIRIHKEKPRIDFMTGGWWTIETAAMKELDWPDPRILHNGGDVMLGAACQQLGIKDKQHYTGIAISKAKRRGFSEKPAGADRKK